MLRLGYISAARGPFVRSAERGINQRWLNNPP